MHRIKVSSNEILKWSIANNYIIITSKFKFFNKGRISSGSLTALVYKVTLKDLNNDIKRCWIRVGDPYFGMLLDKNIYVKWI